MLQSQSQNIPEGYKSSPFGPIPSDWETAFISNLADKIMVGIASAATHAYRNNGIILFRNQNIKEGYLDDSDILFIDENYEKSHKNKRLMGGDILVARTGYPGVACLVPDKYKDSQSFTTLIIRPKHSVIDARYLCYYINSEIGQSFFEVNQIGGGQKNVNAGTLEKMPIPLPSQKEQKKIVEIFSQWDEAILKVSELIRKHEQRKKGLTSRLINKQARLKNFKTEWSFIQFGEFLSESKIPSINPQIDRRITVRLDLRGIEKRDVRGTENEEGTSFYIRKAGQFIYGKQNLHKGAFGILPSNLDGFESSQDIPTFDFTGNKVIPEFFIEYLSQECIYKSLENISTGTGSKRIQPRDLFKEGLFLPSRDEQIAIMKILQESSNEITLLKSKLEKLKEQKKGLMQQLLTGKKRLKF